MGIEVALEDDSAPTSDGGAGDWQSSSSTSFRFLLRTILLDTVAACSPAMTGRLVEHRPKHLCWRSLTTLRSNTR